MFKEINRQLIREHVPITAAPATLIPAQLTRVPFTGTDQESRL